MVVDDVEDDGHAKCVRLIDKAAEIIGRAVKPGRRDRFYAVIAPAEAREFGTGISSTQVMQARRGPAARAPDANRPGRRESAGHASS